MSGVLLVNWMEWIEELSVHKWVLTGQVPSSVLYSGDYIYIIEKWSIYFI